jgi:hypothetical protein
VTYGGNGVCRFDNAGTFRKVGSTGTNAFNSGVAFNNYGALSVRSGLVAASGGFTSATNALLDFGIGGNTAGTGFGQLRVGGSTALSGLLNVDLINGFLPLADSSFPVLTAGSRTGGFSNFSYPSNQIGLP